MTFEKQKGLPAISTDSGRQLQAGQILLIVILVIIVASTVGLSLISSSITSFRTSTEEAESQKALAAAEAGIERAIQGSIPVDISSTSWGNSNYSAEVLQVDGAEILVNGGNSILQNEGSDLWLTTYDSDPTLNYGGSAPPAGSSMDFYWGDSPDPSGCTNPALEVIIIIGPKANPTSKRYAYDPCFARRSGNYFDPPSLPLPGQMVKGKQFYHRVNIDVSGALIARIIPIYGSTVVGIANLTPPFTLPNQGYQITSTGTSGETNRKIRVFKGWPQAYLSYLSYGLFVAKDN